MRIYESEIILNWLEMDTIVLFLLIIPRCKELKKYDE